MSQDVEVDAPVSGQAREPRCSKCVDCAQAVTRISSFGGLVIGFVGVG